MWYYIWFDMIWYMIWYDVIWESFSINFYKAWAQSSPATCKDSGLLLEVITLDLSQIKWICQNCKMYLSKSLSIIRGHYIESLSNWMTLNAPQQYLKHFISIWAHSCLNRDNLPCRRAKFSLFWIEQSASFQLFPPEFNISYHTLSLFLIGQSAVQLSSMRVRDFLLHTFIFF